jgi:uncharacterized phage protein (TIGR01671 family)
MREIKFRVWDIVYKLLTYVDLYWFEENYIRTTNNMNDKFELMQFTGLRDKNEVELYAGDIFKDNQQTKYRCYNVVGGFAHSLPQFASTLSGVDPWPLQPLADEQTVSWFHSCCVIVGNIYQNPELL